MTRFMAYEYQYTDSRQAVFLDLREKRAIGDVEDLRGAAEIAACLTDRLLDLPALDFRLGYGRDWFSFARDALQAGPKRSKINQFGYARFQRARPCSEKTEESHHNLSTGSRPSLPGAP